MTTWVDDPSGGRDRGPQALLRAWVEVLLRPTRFFRTGIAPGDQAPGLTFAMAVVLVEEASRLALDPGAIPHLTGSPALSAALVVALAVLVVTPAVLHLVAALLTLPLVVLADERGGIGQTVQVLAYSTAPCALAGLPFPAVRLLVAAYGTSLLVDGLVAVHGLSGRRAWLAAAIPAAIVYGYGFRGFAALATLLSGWYLI